MKTRTLSQLEIAITDTLVSLEEEFGVLPEEVFSRLEKVLFGEFEKVVRGRENVERYLVLFSGSRIEKKPPHQISTKFCEGQA